MCMLTFYEPDALPDLDALACGAKQNQDGHGYAIVVPQQFGPPKLIVRHSLFDDYLIERFDEERAKYPEGPALFHSRWGTSGEMGKYNCHPFQLGSDRRTVVAHNGILPTWMQPDKADRRCDTRLAAEILWGSDVYGHLSRTEAREAIGESIGVGNKLVILTGNLRYNESSYIINEAAGNWTSDGIWYSNYDWQPYTYRHIRGSDWEWADAHVVTDNVLEQCPVCATYGGVQESGGYTTCWTCRSCVTCQKGLVECDCAIPITPRSSQPLSVKYYAGDRCPLCQSDSGIDEHWQVCWKCNSCLDCYDNVNDCICLPPSIAAREIANADEYEIQVLSEPA